MSENGRTWFRLRWRTLFLLVIAGVVGWSAYSYWAEYSDIAARRAREMMAPPVGAKCTVELNGDDEAVTGRFVMLNDTWIVFREVTSTGRKPSSSSSQRIWIPRDSVRLIRVEP